MFSCQPIYLSIYLSVPASFPERTYCGLTPSITDCRPMRRVPSAAGLEACDKDGHATDYVNEPPSPSAALPFFLRPSMRLLPIETAPPHGRSEFVLYAYRPTCTSWRAAFFTLFRLHNETFNIWRWRTAVIL